MASSLVDMVAVEFEGRRPWSEDATLVQPLEDSQLLLSDKAECLGVRSYLKMCGLPFKVDSRCNAEFMSPSGKVPFVRVGHLLTAEFHPIIALVEKKGNGISGHLSDSDKADMKAYINMVEGKIDNAELFLTWCSEEVMDQFTEPRYGSPYIWPLNSLLVWKKQREVQKELKSKDCDTKSMKQMEEDVHLCCQALSERLGEQDFFFGKDPTELDALVYGHLKSILETDLPIRTLTNSVQSFPNLASFVQRIDKQFMMVGQNTDGDQVHSE